MIRRTVKYGWFSSLFKTHSPITVFSFRFIHFRRNRELFIEKEQCWTRPFCVYWVCCTEMLVWFSYSALLFNWSFQVFFFISTFVLLFSYSSCAFVIFFRSLLLMFFFFSSLARIGSMRLNISRRCIHISNAHIHLLMHFVRMNMANQCNIVEMFEEEILMRTLRHWGIHLVQTKIGIVIYSPLLHYNNYIFFFFFFLLLFKSMILHACWEHYHSRLILNLILWNKQCRVQNTEEQHRKLNFKTNELENILFSSYFIFPRERKKYEEKKNCIENNTKDKNK